MRKGCPHAVIACHLQQTHQDTLGCYTWILGRSLQDKDVLDLAGLDCCTGAGGSALLLHMKQSIGSMFATAPSFHPLKQWRRKKATFHFKWVRLHQWCFNVHSFLMELTRLKKEIVQNTNFSPQKHTTFKVLFVCQLYWRQGASSRGCFQCNGWGFNKSWVKLFPIPYAEEVSFLADQGHFVQCKLHISLRTVMQVILRSSTPRASMWASETGLLWVAAYLSALRYQEKSRMTP